MNTVVYIMTELDGDQHLCPVLCIIPLCPHGWSHSAGISSLLLLLLLGI